MKPHICSGYRRVPTLLPIGGESPDTFEEAEKAVAEAALDSCIVVMAGQGHVAMDTATDLFTTEVLRYLGCPSQALTGTETGLIHPSA